MPVYCTNCICTYHYVLRYTPIFVQLYSLRTHNNSTLAS